MVSEPDNFSDDMTTYNSIDFDQTIFFPDGFRYAYDELGFSEGNGTLDTPTLERTNPLIPSIPGAYSDKSNDMVATDFQELFSMCWGQEPSVPSETSGEEIDFSTLDTQSNDNGMENNSNQQMNADEQARIAEIENNLRNEIDEISDNMDLQTIVTAMNRYPNPIMRIHTEPVARHRFRYRTDGIRYLEQSRVNPMSIDVLPRLDGCLTKPYQSFWLQQTLITTRQNPHRKSFIHQHEMIYNGENAQENGLSSFRIPLTDEDIRRRRKIFRYLSIIKTRRNDYRFELNPFDPLLVNDHVQYYTTENDGQLTKIKKAKRFDREYHTNNYQIVCQLMIKQKDQWYMTDLHCITNVITDA